MKRFRKYLAMFIIFGLIGMLLEVCVTALTGASLKHFDNISYFSFIGYTSPWMFFVYGTAGMLLGLLNENEQLNKWFNLFWQSVTGLFIVYVIEFLSGYLLNIVIHLNIWSYAHLPLNILGQIELLFAPFWFLLCPFAFYLEDYMRYGGNYLGRQIQLRYYYFDLVKVFKYSNPRVRE